MPPSNRGRNGHNGRRHEVPPRWLSGWFDPELEQLFRDEPELSRTSQLLRSARPDAEPDAHFHARLRTSLMAEAARSQVRRRRRSFSPLHLAWTGVGVGVVAIAATVLTLFNGPQPDHLTLVALSNVAAQHSVSPDDVITVSFNQPMDQGAVVAGLHIQPATKVQTAWHGNDLVITPVHHLAGNTPYTVTIARSAARTAAGTIAPAAIQITFGTAATATGTTTAKPRTLVFGSLGAVSPNAAVLFAPDGSVVVTSATPPAAAPGPVPATASPSSSASPSTTAAAIPPAIIEYPASGQAPRVLGQAASAAAFSPNGNLLAVAIPGSGGGSNLVVAGAGGTSPATLIQSQGTINSLAWVTNRRVAYATSANVIRSVDLTGVSRTLSEPATAAGVELSPDGQYAYLAPQSGTGGQLLNIASGALQPVIGSGQSVAFSADGSMLAWLDQSRAPGRLQTQLVRSGARVTVSALDPGAAISGVALNTNGSQIAYVEQSTASSPQTVVAQLPSGTPLAVGTGATSLAFSPDGHDLALIGSVNGASIAQRASVPGATQPTQDRGLAPGARTVLQAFIDAQVHGNASTLTSLSTASADAVSNTPPGLSRAYVLSAAANPDGSITASAELIIDPTSTHPQASKADETLTLAKSADGSSFLITAVLAGGLHDELPGPHVVAVTTAVQHGSVVVQINFDSDLDRSSVSGAITIVAVDGTVLNAPVTYDAETRSATVTLDGGTAGPITVSVSAALRDVDGQSLAAPFSTRASF